MAEKERELLTIPEAARVVGVTRAVLWRHVKAGNITTVQAGRFYLIDREDALRFRDRERKPGRPKSQSEHGDRPR